MKIALASPPYPKSLEDALFRSEKLIENAAEQQAEIICFPETYLPGYPGMGVKDEDRTPEKLKSALDRVCIMAAEHKIAVIMPMDWYEGDQLLNIAHVISKTGGVMGYQTKNQLDPSEDDIWTAGTGRSLFDLNGVTFAITICHEGFRYPESVRWAAKNGAKIVFHPNCTGSNIEGSSPVEWQGKGNPYYEKAQMMRAIENTVYFATSNYMFKYPESASALIAPDGRCIAYQPYREPGVMVAEIDPEQATGLLAKRFKAQLY
jgi:predicted amidohydrolase